MSRLFRTSALSVLGILLLEVMPLGTVHGQAYGTTLTMEPHCIEEDRMSCAAFAVLDADRLTTTLQKSGDLVDIDIVLRTDRNTDVREIRSWLMYDPSVLEARSVELTDVITSPTPGESTIDSTAGLVKIGGSTTGVGATPVSIARVTFRVLKAGTDTTIAFHQYLPGGAGSTAVNAPGESAPGANTNSGPLASPPCVDPLIGCGETSRTPLLLTKPASLVVELGDGGATLSSSASSVRSTASSSVSSVPATTGTTGTTGGDTGTGRDPRFETAPSAFTLLQVQGVAVTTRDNVAYLGWQELKSTELTGYNVYYGAVSGRYLQRRSIPPTYTSTVIRDLEPDTTYYFAIRGHNERNEETMFSREVSVTIGKPETSTAPLSGSGLPTAPGENVVTGNGGSVITGETGFGSSFLALFILCGVVGTAFAFRRQLSLLRTA